MLLVAEGRAGAAADDLQRLASLVDYIAADYPGAVQAGRVIAATEYEEQRALLGDARKLAEGLSAPAVIDAIGRIERTVNAKGPAEEVTAACREVRGRLVEELGLVMAPTAPPSEQRARLLYGQACAKCHGENGDADTEEARKLDPRPASFRDGERMARVSPQLAYHALTFGVKGTGMASFDSLPASDRWSLAFHVVALRHDRADGAAGARAFAAARVALTPTASRLAALSDGEIEALLSPSLGAAADRASAIAWLRRGASFAAAPGGMYGEARRQLAGLTGSERARWHDVSVGAYLEGFEPHEASLRARDRALAQRVELAFLDLRRAIDDGAGEEDVRHRTASILLLLDRAEERPAGPSVAFVAALTIALREGLEAALLIAALLAFLRKSGQAERARLVHLGWLAAIPLGLGSWWIAGALVGGARRELVEAVITLLAALMILLVSHWVLGRHEAKQWVGFLGRRVMALAPGQSGWPLFGLAFIAAGREAFEVVLFYRALLLDAVGEARAVAAGAAVGVVAIAAVVLIVGRLGRRLNPRPVMLASSVLLAALAVALVGRGVRALQEGGFVTLTPVGLPDLSVIGLYPSLQGLIAQAVTLAAIFAPSLVARLQAASRKGTAKRQEA
ncbi:MAG: hypothetical protein EXR72_26425 [Myxococcales bacterium]|nr:hypothetical protein [Myxococcales bacterium]